MMIYIEWTLRKVESAFHFTCAFVIKHIVKQNKNCKWHEETSYLWFIFENMSVVDILIKLRLRPKLTLIGIHRFILESKELEKKHKLKC